MTTTATTTQTHPTAPDQPMRAYRFALDPTLAQQQSLARHAGAARWAFNHAVAAKVEAHRRWRADVDTLVAQGVAEGVARRQVKTPMPTKPVIQKAWNTVKGDSRTGVEGICPWWHEVSTYAVQSAFADADTAWGNWLASLGGRRAVRRVGYPRFKKKGRAREAFRLHHDVKRPTIRVASYRRLLLPRVGEIRIHGTAKPLARLLAREQAVIQSVTISRSGHRWYASVLCKVTSETAAASRSQRRSGAVGVDVGVHQLAALSTGRTIANPRCADASAARLRKAQRALARTQKGSARRGKARARVARLHHLTALRRATALHTLTKELATGWETVALEDLNVAGMTRSARGTLEQPGRKVRQKAGLNRRILDASFAEIRRQLTYKTRWYGSRLVVIDRWAPTSKTCSTCGWRNPSLKLSERTFRCHGCGLSIDRDINAAINIAADAADNAMWQTAVASGIGETQNARRGDVSPTAHPSSRQSPMKREDRVARSPRHRKVPASPADGSAA
jgi:putative transposase